MIQVFFWLKVLDWTLRVILAAHLIVSRRPVPVTLAWLMLLLAPVPFLGVIAYMIVGEPRLGRRRTRRYNQLTDGFLERAAMFWKARPLEWDPECVPYCHTA